MTTEEREALRDDALAAITKAYDVVVALCDGRERWTMSVPARPDSDPDLVIGDALLKAEAALLAQPEGGRDARIEELRWVHNRLGVIQGYSVARFREDVQAVIDERIAALYIAAPTPARKERAMPSETPNLQEIADDLEAQIHECCDSDDGDAVCHRCGVSMNAVAALRAASETLCASRSGADAVAPRPEGEEPQEALRERVAEMVRWAATTHTEHRVTVVDAATDRILALLDAPEREPDGWVPQVRQRDYLPWETLWSMTSEVEKSAAARVGAIAGELERRVVPVYLGAAPAVQPTQDAEPAYNASSHAASDECEAEYHDACEGCGCACHVAPRPEGEAREACPMYLGPHDAMGPGGSCAACGDAVQPAAADPE